MTIRIDRGRFNSNLINKEVFVRNFIRAFISSFVAFMITLVLSGCTTIQGWFSSQDVADIQLDQEFLYAENRPLNSSTQSINRYNSQLRNLNEAAVDFDPNKKQVTIKLKNDELLAEGKQDGVVLAGIESRFLTPLLPYPRDSEGLSEFDSYNLMLAEYSRNGVSLSHQKSNDYFGTFYGSEAFFDNTEPEYLYSEGKFQPNPFVVPKRIGITNNCLAPGLWEVNAFDSVGEMYHGWFNLPKAKYYEMIRTNNDLTVSDWQLRRALKYKKNIKAELNLEQLRTRTHKLYQGKAQLAIDTHIGGYSSQDSRRKVQRNFFKIKRGKENIKPVKFGDLLEGDIFELYAFVPPGVYSPKKFEKVPFNADWTDVEIYQVEPLTNYKGNQSKFDNFGYMEIILESKDKTRSLIIGNIPFALLSFQDDYDIPALGVGVSSPSEPIERRYLRFREGPRPHYAYLSKTQDGVFYGLNNHEFGIEQIFLRPFEREGEVFLRVTLVSYERIVDILELELPLNEKMAQLIRTVNVAYKTPLFRTYLDSNIL